MDCPCGKPVKPHEKGRFSRYCSPRCANRYRKQRQRQDKNVTSQRESVTSVAVERVTLFQKVLDEAIPDPSPAGVCEWVRSWVPRSDDPDVDEVIVSLMTMQVVGVRQVMQLHPVYFSLPPVMAVLAEDQWYQSALPFGYFQYGDECEERISGADTFVCLLLEWEPEEVYEGIRESILIQDVQLALMMPLAWRVGFQVGWLTALARRQPDVAMNGLAFLSIVVAPLLSSFSASRVSQSSLRGPV
jgi:hypothetical protein